MKFVPGTFNVNAGPPATPRAGDSEVTIGLGLETVNARLAALTATSPGVVFCIFPGSASFGAVAILISPVVPAGTGTVTSDFETTVNVAACPVTATATQSVKTNAPRWIALLIATHRSDTRDRTILRIDMGGFLSDHRTYSKQRLDPG